MIKVKDVKNKKMVLTVAEVEHLCYTLSYMARSVKAGLKKSAENRAEYKSRYKKYKLMRDDLIDQIKDHKDSPASKLIEITVQAANKQMLKDFVRQQILLLEKMFDKTSDDLNKNIHNHIVPLQTIAYKLQ